MQLIMRSLLKKPPEGGWSLFARFTRIRAFLSNSSIIVTIAGLCASAWFRNDYARIEWSSVRHASNS
ncbi:hypothetical protein SAMN05444841_11218 [Enterobacter kobei]|nr:hypothetical protein SAMN05444841_11218 [Enterobacter kobei]